MEHAKLIDDLGGPTTVAAALLVPVQTVHSWKKNDRIPHWRRAAIVDLAKAKGVSLPRDFAAIEPSPDTSAPGRVGKGVVTAACPSAGCPPVPPFAIDPTQATCIARRSTPVETVRDLPFAVDPQKATLIAARELSLEEWQSRSAPAGQVSGGRDRPFPNDPSDAPVDSAASSAAGTVAAPEAPASPAPATPAKPESRWAGRTVQCALCERRLSETTVRTCQATDCPHSEQEAA